MRKHCWQPVHNTSVPTLCFLYKLRGRHPVHTLNTHQKLAFRELFFHFRNLFIIIKTTKNNKPHPFQSSHLNFYEKIMGSISVGKDYGYLVMLISHGWWSEFLHLKQDWEIISRTTCIRRTNNQIRSSTNPN